MSLTFAINGFGRIGRNVLRAYIERRNNTLQLLAINDLAAIEHAAFLLEYDSVHGHLKADIRYEGNYIYINDLPPIRYFQEADPAKLNWKETGASIIMECTGRFTAAKDAIAHINAGATRVLVSAPSSGADRTVVYGINHEDITGQDMIISAASCTTNCLAPMAKLVHEACGLQQGFMTTIHAYTGDQRLLDAEHKDMYRARAAASNMIPTTTGAAKAVGLVLPELEGKLDGVAIRVPTPNVSAVDLVFMPMQKTSEATLNALFKEASTGMLKGVMDVTDKPLVSSDFNHCPASVTMHLDQTKVMADGMVRLFGWYDNEWGFSNRMLDIANVLKA
jgi:glyceraldehyde 3-phosphate dehydrogenase